jgi:hypothetical protein
LDFDDVNEEKLIVFSYYCKQIKELKIEIVFDDNGQNCVANEKANEQNTSKKTKRKSTRRRKRTRSRK